MGVVAGVKEERVRQKHEAPGSIPGDRTFLFLVCGWLACDGGDGVHRQQRRRWATTKKARHRFFFLLFLFFLFCVFFLKIARGFLFFFSLGATLIVCERLAWLCVDVGLA
jgi:hypothetical protein